MNDAMFRKTMENVREYRDIKHVTTEARRNYLVSEQNYQTTKIFSDNMLAIEVKIKRILFRSINIRNKENSNVWVLELLRKTKKLSWDKITLHG